MRSERNQNRGPRNDDHEYLRRLAIALRRLASERGLSQQAIEAATGVDQTTISRAKNGLLKRVTKKVLRIGRYAHMRVSVVVLPHEIGEAAMAFLNAGGNEDELLAFIRDATRLVLRHPPSE
jgi:transcriptional regulator with XRE-family HTH domain